MQRQLIQKGLMKASQWAVKAAKDGIQVPISQSMLDNLVAKADDPSIRDLALRPSEGNRLQLSGLKKKGVWVEFTADFRLAAPTAEDPHRSLVLGLERAEPFFARNAVLGALADMDGVSVDGDAVDSLWGSELPPESFIEAKTAASNYMASRDVETAAAAFIEAYS